MRKLLVIVRREYLARARTKAFLITTILMPIFAIGSAVLPGLLFSMKSGAPTHIAVVDQTGKLYESVRESILSERDEGEGDEANDELPLSTAPGANQAEQMRQLAKATGRHYDIEQVVSGNRPAGQIVDELDGRVGRGELDAYVVLPADILSPAARAEYRGRNTSDLITISQIRHSLRRAVIEQRMREANIDQSRVRELSKDVAMDTVKLGKGGAKKDTGGGFGLAMGVGIFMYAAILIYGQTILSSVVEEKTTRLSEILFSSVNPFQLMAGKLVGVSLVGLTQLAIWALLFTGLATYGVAMMAQHGVDAPIPSIPPLFLAYAFLFFVVGFFMFGTLFVLVGSMGTTEKEAGQMAMPVIFLSVASVYMIFPVIRNPNSPLAFWVSISPFFSPVTMLVRIVTETPPFWQIALSLAVGVATIALFTWIASRIYRVGMLMYGKSASLPEVVRWMRQS